ncbi:hypothetical protein [Streptomyces sp. MBT62]|uniref:hypothetical protein n=1 Tax=Streptomyces sp. MBT62 TaxID=2800410 RepID=UPI00190B2F2E|nr:hypothetical protein [Streptomyces sp. MBT62]MBK3567069.1 hypothetical protein [Streptomyces sp. MBT62]
MHTSVARARKPVARIGLDTAAASATGNSRCGVTACCTPAEQAADLSVTVDEAKSTAGCAFPN